MTPTTLFLLVICLIGGINADEPTTKTLTITKIKLFPKPEVSFTLTAAEDAPDDTSFTLTVQTVEEPSVDNEYTMDGDFTAVSNCGSGLNCQVTFKPKFVENVGKPLVFILQGEHSTTKEDFVVQGIEHVTLAEIPKVITAHSVGIALRIKENLDTWSVHDLDAGTQVSLDCDSNVPCYALYVEGAGIPSNLAIAAVTDTTAVPVIVKSFTATALTFDAADPTGITLDYGTTGLTIAGAAGPKSEAIIYKGTGSPSTICRDATAPCESKPAYIPGDDSFKIILIDVGGDNVPTNTKTHEFQDIALNVFSLDATVLEARWTHSANKYTAVRTSTGGGADGGTAFSTVNVDCTQNNGFCYAYYVDLATDGKETVAITPKKIGGGENSLNVVSSAEVTMHALKNPRVSHNSLKNIKIENQYMQSSGNLAMNICVSRDSSAILDKSQLEVVLISEDNQWKRIVDESRQQVEQNPCYSIDFTVISDKDSNTLVTALVIQRDVSSHEVISFSRSDFNLAALRAIKPDVDNDNNGSTSTLAIVGAAITGIACLVALVAAVVMFVLKIKSSNDGLQNPLHRTDIEDSNIIHGLENPIPTM